LQKDSAAFDNVHGLGDSRCGFSIPTAWSAQPIFVKITAALPHQHNLEPSLQFYHHADYYKICK